MIDDELRRQLEAIRAGEITETVVIRPVLCDASRAIEAAFNAIFEDRALLRAAKENFAVGWEPDLIAEEDW